MALRHPLWCRAFYKFTKAFQTTVSKRGRSALLRCGRPETAGGQGAWHGHTVDRGQLPRFSRGPRGGLAGI